MVLIDCPIPSLSAERSSARVFSPLAEKYATGPSSAVLILLPVDSRCCVRSVKSWVRCNNSKLPRMPLVNGTSLVAIRVLLRSRLPRSPLAPGRTGQSKSAELMQPQCQPLSSCNKTEKSPRPAHARKDTLHLWPQAEQNCRAECWLVVGKGRIPHHLQLEG